MVLMRARLAGLACLIAFGCGMGGALAQQPAEPPASPPAAPATPAVPGNLSVLVVDFQALLQNSKASKMVRQQMEAKRAEYQKDLSHQQDALRQEGDALQRQQATMTPDQINAKRKELQVKVNAFDRDLEAKRQALERSNADALQKIQEVMVKIITDIAKDRKANIVLQRSELVLYDPGFDITDEVLQRLDEQLPTLTVNFVAPVAANAPDQGATPAAATPGATPAATPGTTPAATPGATPPKKKK
jgi:Skp family chaperone for outer membrane proteins